MNLLFSWSDIYTTITAASTWIFMNIHEYWVNKPTSVRFIYDRSSASTWLQLTRYRSTICCYSHLDTSWTCTRCEWSAVKSQCLRSSKKLLIDTSSKIRAQSSNFVYFTATKHFGAQMNKNELHGYDFFHLNVTVLWYWRSSCHK